MANVLEDSKLFYTSFTHIFVAPPETEAPDLTKFKFGTPSTYGSWVWIGDTDEEEPIKTNIDGGDIEFLRTADRVKVRSKRADVTLTGTIKALSVDRTVFDLAFAGGTYDSAKKSYKVKAKTLTANKAIMAVFEDGKTVAALRFPNTDIGGKYPEFGISKFASTDLDFGILTDRNGDTVEIFEPRAVTA